MFSIACQIRSADDLRESVLGGVFKETFRMLGKSPHESSEDGNGSIYALQAVIAWLELMTKELVHDASSQQIYMYLADLIQRARKLLTVNFDKLPDTTPRGRYFAFCEELWKKLPATAIKENDEHIANQLDKVCLSIAVSVTTLSFLLLVVSVPRICSYP